VLPHHRPFSRLPFSPPGTCRPTNTARRRLRSRSAWRLTPGELWLSKRRFSDLETVARAAHHVFGTSAISIRGPPGRWSQRVRTVLATEGFVEALPQESQQFVCRPEPQLLSGINVFHQSVEPPLCGFRVGSETNNEYSLHAVRIGCFRRQGVSFPLSFRDAYSTLLCRLEFGAGTGPLAADAGRQVTWRDRRLGGRTFRLYDRLALTVGGPPSPVAEFVGPL